MKSEFEKHFLSLKFATEGLAQRCLDSCTFDPKQDAYLPDVNWISDNDMDECVIYCCMLNTTYISFKDQQSKVDELQKQLIDQGQRFNMQNQQITSLKKQLERLGYTDNGGELMKPPIGESPKFDVLDDLRKRVDAAIYLLPSIKAENDLWGCDQVERQIELLEQALKGGESCQ